MNINIFPLIFVMEWEHRIVKSCHSIIYLSSSFSLSQRTEQMDKVFQFNVKSSLSTKIQSLVVYATDKDVIQPIL